MEAADLHPAASTEGSRRQWRNLTLLSIAMLLAMSLWFSASAVVPALTAADTEANQAEYPQNPAQKEGLGFPILRGVALICMRTGLLLDADVGTALFERVGRGLALTETGRVVRDRPGDGGLAGAR